MLNNLLLNISGISFFIAFDLPRYVGTFHVGVSVVFEILLAACLFYYTRFLDKKYHIFDYFSGYTKKLKGITVFSTLVMGGLYAIHATFNFHSLDYLLTSVIVLLYNLFYTVLFVVFVFHQKKYQLLESYLKDKQETRAYYAKLDEFRHDYLNYIEALEYSLSNREAEESVSLLEHLKKYSLETIDDVRHDPIKKINDSALRGLLYGFMEKADQQKLPYEIKVLNPVTVVNIDYIDLIRLISIALNNALEHYSSDEDAPIQILIDQTPEQFYFKISNPAHMTGVSLGEILKRGYSSKKDGGLGLYNFSKITEEYTNAAYQVRYVKPFSMFELELTVDEI
jgi:sensor histidine kinase YesM